MFLGRIIVRVGGWMTRKVITTTIANKATKEIMKIVSALIDAYTKRLMRRRILKRIAKSLIYKYVDTLADDMLKHGLKILRQRSDDVNPISSIAEIFQAFEDNTSSSRTKDRSRACARQSYRDRNKAERERTQKKKKRTRFRWRKNERKGDCVQHSYLHVQILDGSLVAGQAKRSRNQWTSTGQILRDRLSEKPRAHTISRSKHLASRVQEDLEDSYERSSVEGWSSDDSRSRAYVGDMDPMDSESTQYSTLRVRR